jgi:hypothetical protein
MNRRRLLTLGFAGAATTLAGCADGGEVEDPANANAENGGTPTEEETPGKNGTETENDNGNNNTDNVVRSDVNPIEIALHPRHLIENNLYLPRKGEDKEEIANEYLQQHFDYQASRSIYDEETTQLMNERLGQSTYLQMLGRDGKDLNTATMKAADVFTFDSPVEEMFEYVRNKEGYDAIEASEINVDKLIGIDGSPLRIGFKEDSGTNYAIFVRGMDSDENNSRILDPMSVIDAQGKAIEGSDDVASLLEGGNQVEQQAQQRYNESNAEAFYLTRNPEPMDTSFEGQSAGELLGTLILSQNEEDKITKRTYPINPDRTIGEEKVYSKEINPDEFYELEEQTTTQST